MGSVDHLTWAETVEEILRRSGWTAVILGNTVGVTESMVSKWRNGHNEPSGSAQILLLDLYKKYCG